jgi:two-component system chemotaxis response regulator CheY
MIEQQNLHICLVEPSGVQANIIVGLLEKIGITNIDRVKNGEDAIKTLDGDMAPDVVMSAMYLPDMTGTDLILAIREHPSQSQTPFLLISSETNPHNLEAIRQAGTIAILPKPFSEPQLLRSIQNTLDFLNAEEEQEDFGDLNLSSLRVLIVDDSKVARRHIRSVLERIGFEDFTEVSDGREAMPYIESVLFDLVITDYNMPNVDGLELIDFIRTKSVQSSVPILMVSSLSDEGRLAAVMDAGVSAICDKPFEINLVRNFIKRFLTNADNE